MALIPVSGTLDWTGLTEYAKYHNHVVTGGIALTPNWDSTSGMSGLNPSYIRFGLRRFGHAGQFSNTIEVTRANKGNRRVFTHGAANWSFPGGSLPPHLGGYERYALNARRDPVTGLGGQPGYAWSGTLDI